MSNINYCAIVQPIEVYPTDLERIIEILESTLWPKNSVDQAVMKGLTNFLRGEIEKGYVKRFMDLQDSVTIASENVSKWSATTAPKAKKKRKVK